MNKTERRMLDLLVEGKKRFGFDAVKAEFEAEGTRSDEFLRLLELARRAGLKVGLKIGGCEAVRDLIESKQFGVDYIIAPMVETPYALKKFCEAKNKVYTDEEQEDTSFLFNVETISTYERLDAMTAVAAKNNIGMVFGRVDFIGSMGIGRADIDTQQITDRVVKVAQATKQSNVDFVVGGGLSMTAIDALRQIRAAKLNRFETRKIIFDADILDGDIEGALAHAIDFELAWLKNKRDYYASISREDETRIQMIEKRAPGDDKPAVAGA
jgi:hypothetical protein